ncbi:hypothetical protein LHK_02974 [Laribacter hongkongensis HLHK9]|uniref:Uncharacterized protein n=1 Tax=Laribacter hongkongensis (strain HLHK9) TaxID=557598 RepID=C1D509_LARHH|nr:hypothetical protein LHK_02974 [Laribacter hongkongensis HLHK9]
MARKDRACPVQRRGVGGSSHASGQAGGFSKPAFCHAWA